MQRAYLDHNATSHLRTSARDAMIDVMSLTGNASSIHQEGRKARAILEKSRKHVASLVNTEPKNVIFTSGGTEANMLALSPELVVANYKGSNSNDIHCFISEIEHPCVLSGGRFAQDKIITLPVSGEGVVVLAKVRERIITYKEQNPEVPFLCSVMLANNETGAIQPVKEIAEIVHDNGGLLHVDAVQAAGKIEIDSQALGADFLTLSGHKIGGPQGVGALVLCSAKLLVGAPLLKGGGQELNRRAGTENVAAIAGFGAAAEEAQSELEKSEKLEELRNEIETKLLEIAPELMIFSLNIDRLPNTSYISIPGLTAELSLISLDLKGVAVSSGSACSSGKVDRSHVLKAMGFEKDLMDGAIRISFGWNSTQADADMFISAWTDIYQKFQADRQAA